MVRAIAGLALTVTAGRLTPRIGEPLLVVAIVVASPTLWFDALAMLVAIVPVVWIRSLDRSENRDSEAGGADELVR